MKIPKPIRYLSAGIAGGLASGILTVSYFASVGVPVDTEYEINYTDNSISIVQEDAQWRLGHGTQKQRRVFGDIANDGRLDYFADTRNDKTTDKGLLQITYKRPESTYGDGNPTSRGMFLWLPKEGQPFIKDRMDELDRYDPQFGDLILVMTEDQEQEFNQRFMEVKRVNHLK